MKRLYRYVLIAIALAAMGGCATTTVNKQAFKRPPRLAIITISGAAHGIFTGHTEDEKLLADNVPTCLSEIAKSRHLHLLPAKAVLSNRTYGTMKNQGARTLMALMPGYKEISLEDEKTQLRKLARELHADGFMILYLNFGQESGFGVVFNQLGLGSKKPTADVSISAVYPDGQSMWQTDEHLTGDHGIITIEGIGNFSALISQYQALTKTVCDNSVKDLEKQIASR